MMLTPEELAELPPERQVGYVYRQVREIAIWVSGNGTPEDGARHLLVQVRDDLKKLLAERTWPVWRRLLMRGAEQAVSMLVIGIVGASGWAFVTWIQQVAAATPRTLGQ